MKDTGTQHDDHFVVLFYKMIRVR